MHDEHANHHQYKHGKLLPIDRKLLHPHIDSHDDSLLWHLAWVLTNLLASNLRGLSAVKCMANKALPEYPDRSSSVSATVFTSLVSWNLEFHAPEKQEMQPTLCQIIVNTDMCTGRQA